MKQIILFAVLLLFLSCGSSRNINSTSAENNTISSEVSISGGTGLSIEDAVIINANGSMAGIPAEYSFIEKLHGRRGVDWKFLQQSLQHVGKKSYDIINIQLVANKQELVYYFDITNFFGKI